MIKQRACANGTALPAALYEVDETEMASINAMVAGAMKRLSAHAAINRATPPATVIDPDGGPSRALMDYCDRHNVTLDWALLGEGRKYRAGGNPHRVPVSGDAYELSGLLETCRMAFSNDGLPLPKECWGIGQTLETAARMATKMIDQVEFLERDRDMVSAPVRDALEALSKARAIEDKACTRFNEMDVAGGIGNAEAQAFQVETVYSAQDAAENAVKALLATPSETSGDFLRKVAVLCHEGEHDYVYEGLRHEALRLVETFARFPHD